MILTKSTPRKQTVIGVEWGMYAYGAQSVCIEVVDHNDPKVNYKVDLTKEDLKKMLGYIERREEEIELDMENWRSSRGDK